MDLCGEALSRKPCLGRHFQHKRRHTWPVGAVSSAELLARLRTAAAKAGISGLGVTDASPFSQARDTIVERKAAGLHAGMWFTYGRPERSTDPSRILAGARSVVVCARTYAAPGAHETAGNPNGAATDRSQGAVAAYAAEDAYGALSRGLEEVCEVLRTHGFSAVPVSDDNRLVDRSAAARAGLGWFGRNTMLLSAELGSWTVLGSVVTDADLPVAESLQSDGCGSCRRCQVECPTGALEASGALDANRCLAWLLQAPGTFPAQFRVALGDRMYGCDDCQVVCPYNGPLPAGGETNSRSVRLIPSKTASRSARADVIELLSMTDEQLMETYGHWYIPRKRPEYLRRNALVVLGNIGDPDAGEVAEALRTALASASCVVAAHAVWAARRLGHDDLVADAQRDGLGDHDPEGFIEAELAQAVPLRSGAR